MSNSGHDVIDHDARFTQSRDVQLESDIIAERRIVTGSSGATVSSQVVCVIHISEKGKSHDVKPLQTPRNQKVVTPLQASRATVCCLKRVFDVETCCHP